MATKESGLNRFNSLEYQMYLFTQDTTGHQSAGLKP